MMMNPQTAPGSTAGTSRLTCRNTPPPRLVEHEVAEVLVPVDPPGLLPQRVPRRRGDPSHDHVADLPFGVATDNLDRFGYVQAKRVRHPGDCRAAPDDRI